MAGMGPPPKPDEQRRRRNATVAMTRLPAEGRKGAAPKWPLRPDLQTTVELGRARDERLLLEAQIADGTAADGAAAKLAKVDQRVAYLEEKLRQAAEMERELWRELWRTPQAVQWQRLRWTREVAQYVRWKVAAELGDLDASKEARQLADRLGLTPLAMLRLRWEVVADEVAQRREVRAAPAAKRRLKVVDPDAVAGA